MFLTAYFEEKGISPCADKNIMNTDTKHLGIRHGPDPPPGQSCACVSDGAFQRGKGESARVFFFEILSLLIALPLAEPLVKSSSKQKSRPKFLIHPRSAAGWGGGGGEGVSCGLGTTVHP